ncbi:GNAT family N-acetyltransferase [Sinorhizobium sp. BG8]|uniref:GNAT family N-acetyltransferase n=1 Tax=Sinorhizobium sp. BG8 TaxID=2613773 RepID=UPI00193CC8B3|nr:GNAT family N-acetyltransferase [Sinorhizobium sp. BG8]QRM54973.1 GNAT family N-acetyltransferase [Sinorhizobium sp. BG8]
MVALQLDFQIMPTEREMLGTLASAVVGGGRIPATIPLSIRLHDTMEPLEQSWRALESRNELSLHQSYDWCKAWIESHDCKPLIVEGVSGGQTHLILPLEIVRHGPIRTARFLGSRFSNINTGLYTDEFRFLAAPPRLRKALEQARGQFARYFDLFLLENMPLTWRGETNSFADLPAVLNQNASFQLALFPEFERTLAQVNAKRRRKKFRSTERRLELVGGYEHVIATSAADGKALLDVFFRQKAARFEAMGLPNVFRDAETQDFFHRLTSVVPNEESYPLQLHAVRLKAEHEDKIVAIAGVSRKGDHVICQFGSIDDTLVPDASPGEFLFYLIIRQLCSEGVRLFDFGIGDQPYKRSWCTIETAQHDLLWPTTVAGSTIAAIHRAKAGAKRTIKQNPRLYSLMQRLRSGKTEFVEVGSDND